VIVIKNAIIKTKEETKNPDAGSLNPFANKM